MRVSIVLEDRPDGGLRVYSDDVSGLVLSGADPDEVMSDILPAIRVLRTYGEMTLDWRGRDPARCPSEPAVD